VGPSNDRHPAVAAYHRLLAWDIVKAPKLTRYADRVLNPLMGKSLVVYLHKPPAAVRQSDDRTAGAITRFDADSSHTGATSAPRPSSVSDVEAEAGVGA
jgi:hypothetical protein